MTPKTDWYKKLKQPINTKEHERHYERKLTQVSQRKIRERTGKSTREN